MMICCKMRHTFTTKGMIPEFEYQLCPAAAPIRRQWRVHLETGRGRAEEIGLPLLEIRIARPTGQRGPGPFDFAGYPLQGQDHVIIGGKEADGPAGFTVCQVEFKTPGAQVDFADQRGDAAIGPGRPQGQGGLVVGLAQVKQTIYPDLDML